MALSDLLLIAVGLLVIVLSGMISQAINEFDEYFLIRGQSYVPPDWLIRIIVMIIGGVFLLLGLRPFLNAWLG